MNRSRLSLVPKRGATHVSPPKLDRANLSESAYRHLRVALTSGRYPPGERLRIAALAEQLGVSITPVREAIFRLVSEGLLVMRVATAISVPVLGAAQLREIQLTRLLLEGAAAERAAGLVTPRDIAGLERMHRGLIRAWGRDPAEASEWNREFHFALSQAGAMPIVFSVIERMWTMMGPSLHLLHASLTPKRMSIEEHRHWDVLQALRRGDGPAAREAIQEDIRLSNLLIEHAERQEGAAPPSRGSAGTAPGRSRRRP